jgi:hypothetical protein
MAFDENGKYRGFDPELDPEDAEALRELDRLEQARAFRGQQHTQAYFNQTYFKAMQEECKALGISPEEFGQLDISPEEHAEGIRRGTRKYIKKAIQKAKKRGAKLSPKLRDSQGRFVTQAGKQQPRQQPVKKGELSEAMKGNPKIMDSTDDGVDAAIDVLMGDMLRY